MRQPHENIDMRHAETIFLIEALIEFDFMEIYWIDRPSNLGFIRYSYLNGFFKVN